jgi:hypothetical protein
MTKKMYIGGEWVSARGNATRDVINPGLALSPDKPVQSASRLARPRI